MMLLMVEFVILYSLAPLARFVPCKVYLDHMRQLAGVVANISVCIMLYCVDLFCYFGSGSMDREGSGLPQTKMLSRSYHTGM